MSGRVIDQRGPKKEEEKGRVKANCIKKPPGSPSIRGAGEISVFPLTLVIMDVSGIAGRP